MYLVHKLENWQGRVYYLIFDGFETRISDKPLVLELER